jgi:hypothetical protein
MNVKLPVLRGVKLRSLILTFWRSLLAQCSGFHLSLKEEAKISSLALRGYK